MCERGIDLLCKKVSKMSKCSELLHFKLYIRVSFLSVLPSTGCLGVCTEQVGRRGGRREWGMRKSKWKTVNETVTFGSCVLVVSEIYYWALASLNPLRSQGQATSSEEYMHGVRRHTHKHTLLIKAILNMTTKIQPRSSYAYKYLTCDPFWPF